MRESEFSHLLLPGEVTGRDLEFTPHPESPLNRGPIQNLKLAADNFVTFYLRWIAEKIDEEWILKKFRSSPGDHLINVGGFSLDIASVQRLPSGLITIQLGSYSIPFNTFKIYPAGDNLDINTLKES